MKLQILIPQYQETDDIVRPMLESIAIQQGVDVKNDIEVIIGNDGSDVKLSEELLGSFSYPIRYLQFEHTRLPGCRENLFDASTTDYIMFCDADDMFLTNIALYTIFRYMDQGFDALVCDFMEEIKDRKTGESIYYPHKRDTIFVHGKVFNRQFLLDNHIVWHPELRGHEDSCFNVLAQKVAKDLKYCPIPLYLWKWRDDSICRSDPLYVLKTYNYMIESNTKLVQNFLERGMVDEARFHANAFLYGTYFMMNKPIWLDPMNAKYRHETEKRFQEYYREYCGLIRGIDQKEKNRIIQGTKRRVLREGVILEEFTFEEWIKHIEEME